MVANFITPDISIYLTWPAPNFVNPVERTWLPAFAIIWLVASTILVFGRFYLRARKQAGTFGFDDVLIGIAWLFGLGLAVLACIGSHMGIGRHAWDVEIQNFPHLVKVGYFAQVCFLVCMCTTKLSVLLFYRRMVKDTYSHRWLYILWAAISFNVSAGVATFIVYMVICQPLDAYWLAYQYLPTRWNEPYKCIAHGEGLTLSSCVISIITDIYAVAIPYLMLKQYRLDVPRRQKFALNLIFALGWFATGCGVARTYYLWRMGKDPDMTWTGFDLLAWSYAECQIGIICACAPSLRAFLRQYVNITSLSSHRNSRRISQRVGNSAERSSQPNRDSTRSSLPLKGFKRNSDDPYCPTSPLGPAEKGQIDIGVTETDSKTSRNSH